MRFLIVGITTVALAASLVALAPEATDILTGESKEAAADPHYDFKCDWYTQPPTWGPAIGTELHLYGRYYYCSVVQVRPQHMHKGECLLLVAGMRNAADRMRARNRDRHAQMIDDQADNLRSECSGMHW